MDRRRFIGRAVCFLGGVTLVRGDALFAETFLTVPQAQKVLWGEGVSFEKVEVLLSKEQMRSISKACKVRVRNAELNVWKTSQGGWFIVDQVIGKHEHIDMAVALNADGSVKGLEVMTYRETYGDEIRHPKWREQFHGKNATDQLKLGNQIRNISGATLSCRHVTEGINRLTQTWKQVLQHL